MYIHESNINSIEDWPTEILGYKLTIWSPGIGSFRHPGTNTFVNLVWLMLTFGNFRVIFLHDGDNIVHYTYLTPKTLRFPFMGTKDMMVGPCFTFKDYRRKGLYTEVLKKVISCEGYRKLWICATLTNKASLNTFTKAGFVFYSFARISRLSKIVTLNKL